MFYSSKFNNDKNPKDVITAFKRRQLLRFVLIFVIHVHRRQTFESRNRDVRNQGV